MKEVKKLGLFASVKIKNWNWIPGARLGLKHLFYDLEADSWLED